MGKFVFPLAWNTSKERMICCCVCVVPFVTYQRVSQGKVRGRKVSTVIAAVEARHCATVYSAIEEDDIAATFKV